MSILIIFNLIFAIASYGMFISSYHRNKPKPFILFLVVFTLNAFVVLLSLCNYFGLIK